MAVYKQREVITPLTKKGFKRIEHGNKHVFYELHNEEDKKTGINVHFSKNGQEINDYLISMMAKEMKLSRSQFKNFIECSISGKEYLDILRVKDIKV